MSATIDSSIDFVPNRFPSLFQAPTCRDRADVNVKGKLDHDLRGARRLEVLTAYPTEKRACSLLNVEL